MELVEFKVWGVTSLPAAERETKPSSTSFLFLRELVYPYSLPRTFINPPSSGVSQLCLIFPIGTLEPHMFMGYHAVFSYMYSYCPVIRKHGMGHLG